MSKEEYTKSIKQELKKLNRRIDFKIMSGVPYSDDSRRHKALLLKFRRQRRKGFFGRMVAGLSHQF